VKLFFLLVIVLLMLCANALAAKPFHKPELIFPPERTHNHASCIVECPNGDLLACWYRGVGPEKGDDVRILGSRKLKEESAWAAPFVMADTPNYPDDNPCMFVDPKGRLWLFWPTLLANQWGTAIMKYKISTNYQMRSGPPIWEWQDVIHVTPVDLEAQLKAGLEQYLSKYADLVALFRKEADEAAAEVRQRAANKLYHRLGWMTRAHPTLLPSGRLIVPLYTDTFSISIMAITDDWGKTWITSQPLIGFGNIQPSVVRKNDGTLVAMMRESGFQRRIRISESKDDGLTWDPVGNMELPNPGSGLEVIRLANGHWALVYNDTVNGRHSLAVSISDDEGTTWKWTRHLEKSQPGQGGYSYPSIIQARDGTLHATYSHHEKGDSIKHAHFNEEWVVEGDKD